MSSFKVTVSGKNATDKVIRQSALEVIDRNATTDALTLLAEMVEKPGASEKFVQNGKMLKSFI